MFVQSSVGQGTLGFLALRYQFAILHIGMEERRIGFIISARCANFKMFLILGGVEKEIPGRQPAHQRLLLGNETYY